MRTFTSLVTIVGLALVGWVGEARAQQDNCGGCTKDAAERLWIDLNRQAVAVLAPDPDTPPASLTGPERSLVQILEVQAHEGGVVQMPHSLVFTDQLGRAFAMGLKDEFPAVADLAGTNMATVEACRKLLHLTEVGPNGAGEIAWTEGTVGPPASQVEGAVVKLLKKEHKADLEKPEGERVYHDPLFGYAPIHMVIEQNGNLLADVRVPDAYPCAIRIFDVPDTLPGNEIVLVWVSVGSTYMVGATVYAIE